MPMPKLKGTPSRFLIACVYLLFSTRLIGVGSYWSFQSNQAGDSYSQTISLSDYPDGTPTFSASGSRLSNLGNYGSAYTAFDGSVWQPGKALAWNAQNGCNGNSFQVTFDATNLKDFSIRFKFRNNNTRSNGSLVSTFSSFQYNTGNGFNDVPNGNLSLPNNENWNNQWSMDLTSLSSIEGESSVTLRWKLPDFESTGSNVSQLRIDDLEITASIIPALTNSTFISITKTSNAQPEGYTYPVAIEVPSSLSSRMPVAILLHGRGGNGNGAINQFRSILDNHILIAPSGYEKSWNITDEPSDLPDIAFIRELISQIKSFSNVDSTRIRILGTSNGSGMTNRAFVEIDDPGIDILCPIVSQMHQGNYRDGTFYYPSNEQNTGGAFGTYKGYNSAKTPVSGRRILAITNTNDNSIPYTGGSKFGSDFIHSQLSAYAMAVSQGYTGSQLSAEDGEILQEGIRKFSYLNDQVVHIQGSAGHGVDNNLKTIIREFFNRPPPPNAPSSLQATARATEQINLQWNDNSDNESGFLIQKSPNGNTSWTDLMTLSSNTVIASDLAVDKDETWYYRVRATHPDGPSQWSNLSSATVKRSRQLALSNYNVLFINIDDLKPMIGSFGDTTIKTPKMDLLSSSSLNFTNAHCQQAICTASRASYLTGLRPDSTRVWDLRTHLRDVIPDVVTIPQHFKENGYNSHGIGKIFHGTTLAMQDGEKSFDSWERGNSSYKYHEPAHAAMEDSKTSPLPATDQGEFRRDGLTPVGDSDYSAGVIAELANSKLAQFKTDYENHSKPFFLGVGFYKPHLPFTAPKPYWDLYDPVTDIDLTGYDGTKSMPTGANLFAAPYGGEQSGYSDIDDPPTEAQARRLTHAYMACVSYVDEQVGKIVDELDRLGLADSTIIVLFGDHGFHLADHGAFWAKHSNFENATRTPLIIRVPGMNQTGNSDTPVGLIDVFPTLVDLCSLPYPKQPNGLHLEGTSLLPLIQDPTQPWKKGVFSQYQRRIWKNTSAGDTVAIGNPGNGIGYSIRTRRYRYTEWWRTETSNQDSKGNYTDRDQKLFDSPEMIELYDYQTDPDETVNLAQDPAHTDLVAELAEQLAGGAGWATEAAAPIAKPSYALEVNGGNGGTASGAGTFQHGTLKVIAATPEQGYRFRTWTGEGVNEPFSPNTTVLMDQNRTVTATFSPITQTLTVSAGLGGSASGSGIFSHGFLAPIEALPEEGYLFTGWSGSGVTNSNAPLTTVLMDQNRSVSPTFSENAYSLKVFAGFGGSVNGEGNFSHGVLTNISATPDIGYSFSGWSGSGIDDNSSATTTVLMDQAKTVSATFSLNSYPLSVLAGVGGSVSGDGNFSHGELAPVEAVPAKGYAFAGWSGLGITNSNALVTTVLMDQNRSLTATFSPSSKPLTVYHGIGGSTTGEGNFSYNSEATVEATPDEGYEFSTWTGEGIKEPNLQTTTVLMDQARSVTAIFAKKSYSLVVLADSGGSSTGDGNFSHGSYANIEAIADIGYTFNGWLGSGVTDRNAQSTSILMDQNQSLIATFSKNDYSLWVYAGLGGTATGEGNFSYNSLIGIEAIPDDGYLFKRWIGEGVSDPMSPSTTVRMDANHSVSATFSQKFYQLTLSGSLGGNAYGEGNFSHGMKASIEAIPASGYIFSHWEGDALPDSSAPSTSILMNRTTSLVAEFKQKLIGTNLLICQSSPVHGGTTYGGGSYPENQITSIIASPAEGYSFVGWTGSGISDPSLIKATVNMSEDRNLTANFSINSYTLNLSAIKGGSISGAGSFAFATDANISAIAEEGYFFSGWSGEGLENPSAPSTTVRMTADRNLTANFTPKLYLLNLFATKGGTVSGSGKFQYGSNQTVTATPLQGYSFSGWSGTGIDEASSLSTTVIMTQDHNLTASFSHNFHTLSIEETEGGSVNDLAGSYYHGSRINLFAKPSLGYVFVRWLGDGIVNPTTPSTSLEMIQDRTISAQFAKKMYRLEVSTTEGGSVSGSGTFQHGTSQPVTATPHPGFLFTGWSGTGIAEISSPKTTASMTQDRNLTASFSLRSYNLTISKSKGGAVSDLAGSYDHGSRINLLATPSEGYVFVRWLGDGIVNPTTPSTSLEINQDRTISAQFAKKTYRLEVSATEGGSVSGSGTFQHGTSQSITAKPETGYSFEGWSGAGIEDPRENSSMVQMTEDREAKAIFSIRSFDLNIINTLGGKVNGAGRFSFGSKAMITAFPEEGYDFSVWTGYGVTNPLAASSSVTMTEHREVAANFTMITHQLWVHFSTGGTAIGNGAFDHNSQAPVSANSSPGYSFSHWSGKGVADPYASTTTVDMVSDRNVSAHFSVRKISSTSDAIALGENWFAHWLGSVFESETGWCYHLLLGWVFPIFDEQEGVWIWLPGQEWIWTDRTIASDSLFWSDLDSGWRFYYFSQTKRLRFFRYIGQSWTKE